MLAQMCIDKTYITPPSSSEWRQASPLAHPATKLLLPLICDVGFVILCMRICNDFPSSPSDGGREGLRGPGTPYAW